MDQDTAIRCLNIAKGCHDYNGGHRETEMAEAFHDGVQTVINCLEKFVEISGDNSDIQLSVVESIGERGR